MTVSAGELHGAGVLGISQSAEEVGLGQREKGSSGPFVFECQESLKACWEGRTVLIRTAFFFLFFHTINLFSFHGLH